MSRISLGSCRQKRWLHPHCTDEDTEATEDSLLGEEKWRQLIEKDLFLILLLWGLTPWLVLAFCFWSSWQ